MSRSRAAARSVCVFSSGNFRKCHSKKWRRKCVARQAEREASTPIVCGERGRTRAQFESGSTGVAECERERQRDRQRRQRRPRASSSPRERKTNAATATMVRRTNAASRSRETREPLVWGGSASRTRGDGGMGGTRGPGRAKGGSLGGGAAAGRDGDRFARGPDLGTRTAQCLA